MYVYTYTLTWKFMLYYDYGPSEMGLLSSIKIYKPLYYASAPVP